MDAIILWIKQFLYWPLLHGIEGVLNATLFSPIFFGAVVLILLLERLYPVKPEQKMFSMGFMQDSVWLVIGLLFEGIVAAAYVKMLRNSFLSHPNFLTLNSFQQSPVIFRFILGVVVTDFLAWLQHLIKHKVPWFWQIHKVHHSQREINMFTDVRNHFLEYIISRTIVIIPLTLLGIETPQIAAWVVFNTWFTRLYHANIKTNLGFLRYVVVTPQSHRVHHSIEHRHQDKNFGVIFSFWDRIFKTQNENCDEYPETGVEDSSFPLEKETSLLSLLIVPLRQLIHPFIVIGRSFLKKRSHDKRSS